jgi:GNAT superfamily N-acetyltransferase
MSSSCRIVLLPDELVSSTRAMVAEYVVGLGVDLSFQNIDDELKNFPASYASPDGAFIVAIDDDTDLAGCVGVRRFADGVGEVKRLYVRPAHRGQGLGRALALAAIERARALGYLCLRLDTLATMHAARALYRELGFVAIPPYTENPLPGTSYFELRLDLN